MSKRKVVVTGAAGLVVGIPLPVLRERYDVTLLDVKTTNRQGEQVEGIVECDLRNPDREAYREHFRGADAVVHGAFVHPAKGQERYFAERDNLDMAYNVYKVALEENVRRVVVIGSNHATDFHERLWWEHRTEMISPETMPLSDNFYGWCKSAYELMGFVFASGGGTGGTAMTQCVDRESPRLENVQIRIGAPRETDIDQCKPGEVKKMDRALATYLSARDHAQLIVKSIETENIEDENGIPFQVFYGISGNTHAFWSIANARRVIGYAPEDNSEVKFAEKVREILAGVSG